MCRSPGKSNSCPAQLRILPIVASMWTSILDVSRDYFNRQPLNHGSLLRASCFRGGRLNRVVLPEALISARAPFCTTEIQSGIGDEQRTGRAFSLHIILPEFEAGPAFWAGYFEDILRLPEPLILTGALLHEATSVSSANTCTQNAIHSWCFNVPGTVAWNARVSILYEETVHKS